MRMNVIIDFMAGISSERGKAQRLAFWFVASMGFPHFMFHLREQCDLVFEKEEVGILVLAFPFLFPR